MLTPRVRDHLAQLEAESIHIMREVVAQFERPVMLYSIGKDSSVMLHLAMKAFWPSRPPFPLLHIDTTWKFKEMIAFRDRRAAELGLALLRQIYSRRFSLPIHFRQCGHRFCGSRAMRVTMAWRTDGKLG